MLSEWEVFKNHFKDAAELLCDIFCKRWKLRFGTKDAGELRNELCHHSHFIVLKYQIYLSRMCTPQRRKTGIIKTYIYLQMLTTGNWNDEDVQRQTKTKEYNYTRQDELNYKQAWDTGGNNEYWLMAGKQNNGITCSKQKHMVQDDIGKVPNIFVTYAFSTITGNRNYQKHVLIYKCL